MATRYSQEIKTNQEELTFDMVRNLYEWITHCVKDYNAKAIPCFDIRYKRGDISCTTDNYEEFIRDTYGLSIAINSFIISYYQTMDLSFHIGLSIDTKAKSFKKYVEITIYSDNIQSMSTIVPSLQNTIVKGHIKTPEQIKQLPEISINVGGDLTMAGSSIGNGNEVYNNQAVSAITKKDTIQEETSFWEGVKQQLVANWIWWLLGLILTICLGYLGFVSI